MGNDSKRDGRTSLAWLVVLAALAIGVLVLALGQVARQAVRQGEIRHAATVANTAALWRCHGSHSRALRDSCLAQLNQPPFAPSQADATPPGQHIAVIDLAVPIRGQ